MNFNSLLNQVLGSVQKSGGSMGKSSDLLGKLGGGAAVAGLASMFLKNKNAKKLVTAGSVAALGALAYHAYQSWQRSNAGAGTSGSAQAPVLDQAAFEPSGQAAENAGRIILRTMIAAAAADGLIEEEERRLIQAESANDPETARWIDSEIQRPAQPTDIAREIGNNPALAAEAYLAARLACGDLARKEIVFLSQLSQALNLDDKLVESLERQAGF